MAHYRAPLASRLWPSSSQISWQRKRRQLAQRVEAVVKLCDAQRAPLLIPPVIPPEWVLAILWDELVRRDISEQLTDWLLGQIGRDPSVGLFQVTGKTAREVAMFCDWGEPYRELSLRALRKLLLSFPFAAKVVIGRCQQILEHWRSAGFDPSSAGGLGRHRLTALALVGTLYSQGLGTPHPHPRSNGRGRQIVGIAAQIRQLWLNRATSAAPAANQRIQ